jgi:hypothetical protein
MPRPILAILLPLLLFAAHLRAQPADSSGVIVGPPELYPGPNVVTVRAAAGVRAIEIGGVVNAEVKGGTVEGCPQSLDLPIDVTTAGENAGVILRVTDCRGIASMRILAINTTWKLARVDFGDMEAWSRACRVFRVFWEGLPGEAAATIDSITVADPAAIINLPSTLPTTVDNGKAYLYGVCYQAATPGVHAFPVTAWIRRRYPSGGYGTYAVSDTGYVSVLPPPSRVTDPTTFRSVAVPNAIIPKRGRVVAGSYDLLGLMAGYAPTDNVMLLAAGAPPTPDDWGGVHNEMFGAYSVGVKGGLEIVDRLNVALGFQWGTSFYDRESTPEDVESKIGISVPYAAVSYGDDDSRVSATLGYGFKHHRRYDPTKLFTVEEFDREVMIGALGGDYRLGEHWKIAGEIATMETLGVVPIIATGRYFTNSFAIDAGVAFLGITTGDGQAPKIPVVPVVSALFVF